MNAERTLRTSRAQTALATNSVLRNTYMLLSLTLLFSALVAGTAVAVEIDDDLVPRRRVGSAGQPPRREVERVDGRRAVVDEATGRAGRRRRAGEGAEGRIEVANVREAAEAQAAPRAVPPLCPSLSASTWLAPP